MSCCLSVYFLVVFKTILKGLWTFGFVRLKIFFWLLFLELGGLQTPSVTRLSLATSRLVETLVISASFCAQVTCSVYFRSAFSLFSQPLYIRVHRHLEDNSQFSYILSAALRDSRSNERILHMVNS